MIRINLQPAPEDGTFPLSLWQLSTMSPNMKKKFPILALLTVGMCQEVVKAGTPKIEFEQTVHQFGKFVESKVMGSFKFRNAGDGLLKLEKPSTSCGCTIATLKKDSLNPGETAELSFSLSMSGLKSGPVWKSIRVASNDPGKPTSLLTIKGQYTPLYETLPLTLKADVGRGEKRTGLVIDVVRTDGQPARIQRLEPSKPWISATLDPGSNVEGSSARILVEVRGGDTVQRFNEYISVYAGEASTTPVVRLMVIGQVKGGFTVTPERLFWSITDPAKTITELPELLTKKRLVIRSSGGKEFTLTNPRSTVKGLKLELKELNDGKGYEMVARLTGVPQQNQTGSILLTTSLVTDPKIKIPVSFKVVQARETTVSAAGKAGQTAQPTGPLPAAGATPTPLNTSDAEP